MLQIAPVYAGLLTVIFLILSVRVIDRRRSAGVSLGDGGDGPLQRRIRAHGNFAEYAPMGLILLTVAELAQGPAALVHIAGATLAAGRVMHGLAVGSGGPMGLRVAGMALTFGSLVVAALAALI